MKYLLRYSYYIGIALVFAALISLLTKDIRYELIAPISAVAFARKEDSDTDSQGKSPGVCASGKADVRAADS